MTVTVTIAGDKAGADKSILGANLSHYLNRKGHRTGLLVAGARQPVWGVEPENHWPAVLEGRLPLDKAIHKDIFGIDLMVARNCGRTLQELSTGNGTHLSQALETLGAYTYLLVDCTSLTSPPALACCLAAAATVVILTPDSAGLTAAYEWLARLVRHKFQGPVHMVLNQVDKPSQTRSIYLRFRDQVQNRLNLHTSYWGCLNNEPGIDPQAVQRYPLLQTMSRSELLKNIHSIGDRLVTDLPPQNPSGSPQAFWKRFLKYLRQIHNDRAVLKPDPPSVLEGRPTTTDGRHPATENAQALTWLNTQLTNIAHDLQAIRRLLEAGSASETAPAQGETLDFDAFIGRHASKHEEQ
jgi:MinD-like ATPase involved in chromosome partitioning or flagellar assembly